MKGSEANNSIKERVIREGGRDEVILYETVCVVLEKIVVVADVLLMVLQIKLLIGLQTTPYVVVL